MKKRILSVLAILCLLLCLTPMTALADEAQEVVRVDVGGADVDNENFKIDSANNRIILRKRDTVIYELSGTTDRKISLWGSNNAEDVNQAFYIRANGVTVNGGIVVENSPVKMVLELAADTENVLKRLLANDLTIKGSGTLRTTDLSITQKTSYMPSALSICDANILVECPETAGDSSQWNGPCVLSGNASVKYIGGGKYAALKVGVKTNDTTHSLTLKDNAKLYCLQKNAAEPADCAVDGLDIFGDTTKLILQDNSYLEAEGKASTDSDWVGCAIASDADIEVKDQATLKARAYGAAVSTWGNMTVSGGNVEVGSENGNGIYTEKTLTVSDGARVKATGYYPVLFGNAGVSITDSSVEAAATADVAIFSRANVTIANSLVKVTAGEDYDGIAAWDTISVSGSWVATSGDEDYGEDISDSVLFNKTSGKVIGNAVLPFDATVAEGETLRIPEGTSLKVGTGKALENHGTVTIEGSFDADGGTVICTSHSGGESNCVERAKCALCGEAYGDPASDVHSDLKHVEAKAATETEEGNIEYWYCEGCHKYYSDKEAAHEITEKDTVTEKLPAQEDDAPETGDRAASVLWVILLAACAVVVAAAAAGKKSLSIG